MGFSSLHSLEVTLFERRAILLITVVFALHAGPLQAGVGHGLLSLFGRGTIRTPLPASRNAVPEFSPVGVQRVVMIILENGNPERAESQQFMIDRAKEGMVLRQYFAVAHPSQPNYIALISGSLAGTNGDWTGTLDRDHLGKHLPARWKVYAEDYPTPNNPNTCSSSRQAGTYVRRHVPFLNFKGVDCSAIVRLNSDQTPQIVSSSLPAPRDVVKVTQALRDDLAGGTLPAFVMIIPNLTDDGHSRSNMANANDWLVRYIAPLLKDTAFTTDTVFVLTFDEDDNEDADHPNRVYAVLWGDHVLQGVNDDIYDHEDLFVTIAALLKVTPLPATEEARARPIGGIWK
ncbi:MAG: hypothetical protein DMF56_26690 [Acidobacteria bacterium]|nr:MAG: hypothetical protein DMF56_26690 [Acidobacteriota bacterium]